MIKYFSENRLLKFEITIIIIIVLIKISFFSNLTILDYLVVLYFLVISISISASIIIFLPFFLKLPTFMIYPTQKKISLDGIRVSLYLLLSTIELLLFFPGAFFVMFRIVKYDIQLLSKAFFTTVLEIKTNNIIKIICLQLTFLVLALAIYKIENEKSIYLLYFLWLLVICNLLKYLAWFLNTESFPKSIRATRKKTYLIFIITIIIDSFLTILLFVSINYLNHTYTDIIGNIKSVFLNIFKNNLKSFSDFLKISIIEKTEYLYGYLIYATLIINFKKYREFQRNDDDYFKMSFYYTLIGKYNDAYNILKKVFNKSQVAKKQEIVILVAIQKYDEAYSCCKHFLEYDENEYSKVDDLSIYKNILHLVTTHNIPIENVLDIYLKCVEFDIDDLSLASITNIYLLQKGENSFYIFNVLLGKINNEFLIKKFPITVYTFVRNIELHEISDFHSKIGLKNLMVQINDKSLLESYYIRVCVLLELKVYPDWNDGYFSVNDIIKSIIEDLPQFTKELKSADDLIKLTFYGRLKHIETDYIDFNGKFKPLIDTIFYLLKENYEEDLTRYNLYFNRIRHKGLKK